LLPDLAGSGLVWPTVTANSYPTYLSALRGTLRTSSAFNSLKALLLPRATAFTVRGRYLWVNFTRTPSYYIDELEALQLFPSLLFPTAALLGMTNVTVAVVQPPSPLTRALRRLFLDTRGQSWRQRTGWLSGDACDGRWFGVECSSAVSRTSGLLLPSHGSPPFLGNGRALISLNLGNNSLSGTLPPADWVWRILCKELVHLRLDHNSLNGTLPSGLRHCHALQTFAAGGNQLRGRLPMWVAGHRKLETLLLYRNRFNSTVPAEWANAKVQRNGVSAQWSNAQIRNLRLMFFFFFGFRRLRLLT
jgi:hypothetical protein